MKIRILGVIALLVISVYGFGQEAGDNNFQPSGKPLLKIFTNVHDVFTEDGSAPAFEVTRAYFGYGYDFSPAFSTKITLDVGDPGEGKLHQTMYLKNALLQYSKNNLTVNFGLVGTHQFAVQENFWSRRYLYKSFQDAYGFGASADLGVTASYKISDAVSVDASVLNGEGYKNLQNDSVFKTAIGLTVKPAEGLTLRGYFDYLPGDAAQTSLATFAGYANSDFSLGVEYNLQNNHNRVDNHELSGISAYGSFNLGKKTAAFARYDYLTSNELTGAPAAWNIASNGQVYIAGIEFNPVKGVKISPNFQGWSPAVDGASFVSSIYLNLELKF